MPISFNQVPANIRVPFVYVEFDASNAVRGASKMPYTLLLIGQRLAAGTVAEAVPTLVTSGAQAAGFFGAGSMLAQMADAALANSPTMETWAIALDDNVAGVASTGTITLGAAATAAGTLSAMIGGVRVQVPVAVGDTAATVAAALAAAITAETEVPVSAVVNATPEQIDLTAKHKGTVGDAIDVRFNYYAGEATPEGLTTAVGAMAGGAGDPDMGLAVAAMTDRHYNLIAHPFTDAANLTAIEAEMADRWGPLRQIEGVAVTCATGSHATLGVLGSGRNSPHSSIMHGHGTPTPTWRIAAAYGAVLAHHGELDPARPFQTLELKGVMAPAQYERFTQAENNLLLFDGVSTFMVDAGGLVRVQRAITTYQTNAQGAPDIAYLDVNTPLTLGYLRFDFRNYILRKYPRHKLAGDAVRPGRGQAIITPKIGRAEAVARFQVWEELALVEDIEQFKAELIVERNATDPNRLDWFLPPNLVNQFRVGAAQIGFVL